MTDDAQLRYEATARLLVHIDEDDPGPVPPEEDPFGPLDLDEGTDTDGDYPDAEMPQSPRNTSASAWDATTEPSWDEFIEYGPVEALPASPTSSTSEGANPADPDDGQFADFHGDGYTPDAAYPGGDDAPGLDYGGDFGPIDAEGHPTTAPAPFGGDQPGDDDDQSPTSAPRFSKPIVIGFLGAVAVVTIGLAAVMVGMQSSSTVATLPAGSSTAVSVVLPPAAPPAPASLNDPSQDVPIPFQASSPCPQAGSGSAQNVASDDPTRAWVCMRDSDGQVMTLDFGKPMKVTAIELTPGWVGTDASGADQWMAHRVVTRVQWILINGADRTVVTQDTKNAHGSVPQAMPSNGPDQGVLASQIQMVILQTSRPPADNPAPTTPGAGPSGGGLLDGMLGAPVSGDPPGAAPSQDPNFGTTDSGSDPVDNTVAISSIKILGHPPL